MDKLGSDASVLLKSSDKSCETLQCFEVSQTVFLTKR